VHVRHMARGRTTALPTVMTRSVLYSIPCDRT
jgi:hypothetical protein